MAIKVRRFKTDKTSELISLDKAPWGSNPDITNDDDVICTSLNVQASGMSIGLAKGGEYGLGLYAFNGELIKALNPDSDPNDDHYQITKRDATQAITDKDRRGSGWESVTLVAYDASDPHIGNPTLFVYNTEDTPFFSNILGQLLSGAIGLTNAQLDAMVASSAPNNTIYYKFEILSTPNSVPAWITPKYPALGQTPYTGQFSSARITKIAFPDPRDDNKMTTYTLNLSLAGPSTEPVGIAADDRSRAYPRDLADTTFQESTVIPNRKSVYNICRRSHLIDDPFEQARPIKITDNETGQAIQISFPPLTDALTPTDHPLALAEGVYWSDITHDRKNKYVLSTYHPDPPEDRSEFQSKLIIIPTSFTKPLANITPISFVNATRTVGNAVACVDEVSQLVYILDGDTDAWRPASYLLHKREKFSAPPELPIPERQASLANVRSYPLGRQYKDNNQIKQNQYYFYDEYPTGVGNNLFPLWIDYTD